MSTDVAQIPVICCDRLDCANAIDLFCSRERGRVT